ncbi:transposase (plasmid) [Rhodococcus ruber]|nr:transposase [Rhodococcus ruber]
MRSSSKSLAELANDPLAHLPSGKYVANTAWLAHAVITFNLASDHLQPRQ